MKKDKTPKKLKQAKKALQEYMQKKGLKSAEALTRTPDGRPIEKTPEGIIFDYRADPIFQLEHKRRSEAAAVRTELRNILAQFAGMTIDLGEFDGSIGEKLREITLKCLSIYQELLDAETVTFRTKQKAAQDFLNYFFPKESQVKIKGTGPSGEILLSNMLDPKLREQLIKIAPKVALQLAHSVDEEVKGLQEPGDEAE